MNRTNEVRNHKNIAIIGLGWLGLPLAKSLFEEGHQVKGSVSSEEKLARLQNLPFPVMRIGIEPNGIQGDVRSLLEGAEVLIITIPPGRKEGVEDSYPALIEQLIHEAPPGLSVIYTSTTGVYADGNKMVDEKTEPNPSKPSGKAVLAAERRLSAHFGGNLTVLRLAGLIGADRHPGRFLAGKTGLKNGNAPVNLVHQADCIGVIQQVIENNAWGQIINVCAGMHPMRKEYYQKACAALGLEPPQFDDVETSSFKIVDNAFGRELLNYSYQFDDPGDIFEGGLAKGSNLTPPSS